MTLPSFYDPDLNQVELGARVIIAGPEGHHAIAVKRISVGESLMVVNGTGLRVVGEVVSVTKKSCEIVVSKVSFEEPPATSITAVQALAKGDRDTLAIQMLTEIGVRHIIPWASQYSQVSWRGDRAVKGQAKWQATAKEAMKQSRRSYLPVVANPIATADLVAQVKAATTNGDLVFVLHESASEWLSSVSIPAAGQIWIIIGPEGGISDRELHELCEAGATPVLISDGVLRTSTAGVVAASMIRYAQYAERSK